MYTSGETGMDIDYFSRSTETVKEVARMFPSVYFLLPNAEIYKNDTLVQIADKKYAIEDIDELLR